MPSLVWAGTQPVPHARERQLFQSSLWAFRDVFAVDLGACLVIGFAGPLRD